MSITALLMLSPIFILLFPLPALLAYKKKHPYKEKIALTNVLGFWLFGIGWIVALAWCFIGAKSKGRGDKTVSVAAEIERMYKLKKKGILTEAEFEAHKRSLLGEA